MKKIKINEKNFLKIPNKKEIWLEIKSHKKYQIKEKLKIKENYFLMLSFPKENKNKTIINIKDLDNGSYKNLTFIEFLKNFVFLGYMSGL